MGAPSWRYRLASFALSSLGSMTIGLGVSVFMSMYFLVYGPYCSYAFNGCSYALPGVMAFVFPGVWGSVGTFICGLLGMKTIRTPTPYRAYLSIIAAFAAFLFQPAMIVLSLIQAITVTQPVGTLPALYTIATNYPSQNVVLFILPLLVAIIGAIQWVVLLGVLGYVCYCFPKEEAQDGDKASDQPIAFLPPFGAVPYSPYGALPYRRPYPLSPAIIGPRPLPNSQLVPYGPAGIGPRSIPNSQVLPYGPLAIRRPVTSPVVSDPRQINSFSPYGPLPYRRPFAGLPPVSQSPISYPRPFY